MFVCILSGVVVAPGSGRGIKLPRSDPMAMVGRSSFESSYTVSVCGLFGRVTTSCRRGVGGDGSGVEENLPSSGEVLAGLLFAFLLVVFRSESFSRPRQCNETCCFPDDVDKY